MTIAWARERGRVSTQPVRNTRRVRQALLVCGILSSLLYVATDILGGLRYEGYSVTSCHGFTQPIPVATRRTNWATLKAHYR